LVYLQQCARLLDKWCAFARKHGGRPIPLKRSRTEGNGRTRRAFRSIIALVRKRAVIFTDVLSLFDGQFPANDSRAARKRPPNQFVRHISRRSPGASIQNIGRSVASIRVGGEKKKKKKNWSHRRLLGDARPTIPNYKTNLWRGDLRLARLGAYHQGPV